MMTAFPQLSNEQIDAIMAYADHGGKPYGEEIDPARIAAIKSEEFQNTIIATKEFEERLQVIFSKCAPEILNLYVNNLDKPLYVIDSMAVNRIEGNEFREFYARRDGGIAIDQPHLKKLQEYYARKQEAVRIASEKTFASRTAEQRKQDSLYYNSYFNHETVKYEQIGNNLQKEYEINLREVYGQLGISPKASGVLQPTDRYYGVEVPTTGWMNIDRFVWESTVGRTSMDYTDPYTGKRAQITYDALQMQHLIRN
jgi:hypothetical protein